MSIYIEDTARNTLVAWTTEAARRRPGVLGAILNPFTSPVRRNGFKQSAQTTVSRMHSAGLQAWFDPMTHVLQMPHVGDFRYYDEWPLWGTATPDWSTEPAREDHVRRVFAVQDNLDVPRLAPTLLLHTSQSTTSQHALDMATYARSLGQCAISVVGDSSFWSSPALDAHVAALAQLQPSSWHLAVARTSTVLPVAAAVDELLGLSRTCLALSEDAPIHISHGDMAALPAAACGAVSVGTGWDPRQRVLAYGAFEARPEVDPDSAGGGGWFQRVTFAGLFGSLKPAEAALVGRQAGTLSRRLLPGSILPPGPKEAFFHHVDVLEDWFSGLAGNAEIDVPALRDAYERAGTDWGRLAVGAGVADASAQCSEGYKDACDRLISEEGW